MTKISPQTVSENSLSLHGKKGHSKMTLVSNYLIYITVAKFSHLLLELCHLLPCFDIAKETKSRPGFNGQIQFTMKFF